jgi:hypothetical protein
MLKPAVGVVSGTSHPMSLVLIKTILLTLLISTSVNAGFFMNALESVRDAGVAVSGIVVDGYYGIGDVIDTMV